MNDRKNEMDYFLKFCSNNYSTPETFNAYNMLTRYDIPYDEIENRDVIHLFSGWLEHYDNNKQVYINFAHPSFCTFHSKNGVDFNCFKLYLNVPKEKLDECVKLIFDFIGKNNIVHRSKVADRVRADGIVIRIKELDAANMVINFINSNKSIVDCARRTNPFVAREGVVGISYDKDLSYNSFVSNLINDYLEEHYKKSTLKNVNVDDFTNFVMDYYNKYFTNSSGVKDFINTSLFKSELRRISGYNMRLTDEDLLLNYERVCRILLTNLSDDFDLNNFKHQILEYQDLNLEKDEIGYFKKLNDSVIYNTNTNFKLQELLEDYLKIVLPKYGLEQTITNLNSFVNNEDYNCITREQGIRQKFYNSSILNYLKSISISENVISTYRKIIIEIINYYIEVASSMYDLDTVVLQLKTFLQSGNYDLITRNNELRDLFQKYKLENAKKYLVMDVDTYVNAYFSVSSYNVNKY